MVSARKRTKRARLRGASMASTCMVAIGISAGLDLSAVNSALAQDATAGGAPNDRLQEVVVSAQKREQNLQDVGIAVTAFSATDLKEMGIRSTADLPQQTPGFMFVNPLGNAQAVGNPVIRGVSQNDFSPQEESPVAMYIDNAYMSFTTGNNLGLFDLDRVEIDKGPQGTLFGRNATGGLIQLTSKKPTDYWDGYIDQTAESFNGFKTEGAIGGPISDNWSFRMAFYRNSHDGYVQNVFPGTHAIGQDDTYSGRLHVQYKSSDGKLTALFTVQGSSTLPIVAEAVKGVQARPNAQRQGTDTGVNTFDPDPANKLLTDQPFDSKLRKSIYGVTGDVTYDLDFAKLESVTNYTKDGEADTFDAALTAPPFSGGGVISDASTIRLHADANQITQELRLSNNDGPFRWVGGLYFFRQSGTYINDLGLGFQADGGINAPILPESDTLVPTTMTDVSYAGFGQVEYDIQPNLTAILGYRLTEDDKSLYIHPGSPLLSPVLSGLRENLNGHDSAFKTELDWHVSAEQLLYAGITRGNKAGGFELPVYLSTFTRDNIHFGAEDLTDYEIGSKTTFWDQRARFNISGYYYDYRDFQSFAFIGLSAVISNLPAKFYGSDADFSVNAGYGITVSGGAAFEHTDVYGYSAALPDNRAAIAPTWKFNGSISKDARVGNGIITAGLNFVYTDHYFQALPNSNSSRVPPAFLANTRIGYIDNSGWEVAFFVRNLFDRRNEVLSFDTSGFGYSEKAYGPPRWFGGELRYHFGAGGGL